MSQQQTLSQ